MTNFVTEPIELEEALNQFKRDLTGGKKDQRLDEQKASEERQGILNRFPLEAWPQMTLERYALGQPDQEDTYCRWLEFISKNLGSIRGGSASKHIIFKHNSGEWSFPAPYSNVEEAWLALRAAFVKVFELAKANDYDEIDKVEPLQNGPALRTKSLSIYFPDKFLPINSKANLIEFLKLLNYPQAQSLQSLTITRLNRTLLELIRSDDRFKDLSNWQVMEFLYTYFNPNRAERIVKIAPGANGKYWEDCRKGGYICVGWDEIGDLSEFRNDKAGFKNRFKEIYSNNGSGHATKKAEEVWTLMELKPGDLVVANKGTSTILGLGKVTEEGYVWHAERSENKHTIGVEWDTSYSGQISPQPGWAFVTVAKVSPEVYKQVMALKNKPAEKENGAISPSLPVSILTPTPALPPDPIYKEIADALERKGQVILYGPPGTGKTYTARNFAAWWLSNQSKNYNPTKPLDYQQLEKELTTVQVNPRAWWIVANPTVWAWNQLFKDGKVEYRYGRLKGNYPLVQPGDLVFGYQSNPDKELLAIAKISRGFGPGETGSPTIELAPLTMLEKGIEYDELLQDPTLKLSEPMRFRNQGTLFALTQDETEYLLALLEERNPGLRTKIYGGSALVNGSTLRCQI